MFTPLIPLRRGSGQWQHNGSLSYFHPSVALVLLVIRGALRVLQIGGFNLNSRQGFRAAIQQYANSYGSSLK